MAEGNITEVLCKWNVKDDWDNPNDSMGKVHDEGNHKKAGVIALIFSILTLTVNLFLNISILSSSKLRNQRWSSFIVAIAVGDALFILAFLFGQPIFLGEGRYALAIRDDPTGCKLFQILMAYLLCLPWFIFIGLNLDRLYAIKRPMEYQRLVNPNQSNWKRKKKVLLAIAACWAVAALGPIPLLFDSTIEAEFTKGCKCSMPLNNQLWVLWQSTVCFLLPVCLILAIWASMVTSLYNHPDKMLRKVTVKIVGITALFLVCTLPLCFVFLAAGVAPPNSFEGFSRTLPLNLLNSLLQPIIYFIISPEIRQAGLELVGLRKQAGERDRTARLNTLKLSQTE